jgi:hypothetical protein
MVPVSIVSMQLSALASMTAGGGVLNGAKVHLYQNNYIPSKSSALADFTECTYAGYAAQSAGTWGAPYVGVDGLPHVTCPSLQFQSTDGVTPNVAYGVYVTNAGSTVLLFSGLFDQPVPMIDATTGLVYEPDYIFGY